VPGPGGPSRRRRFYFKGESYKHRNENRINIHNRPFVVGRIVLRV
jgi:hypothetical protein